MTNPDPRLTAARGDIAARGLEGLVQARQFVDGTPMEVREPRAGLRRSPHPDALLDTEALRGETFTVYDRNDEGWCWGQLAHDNYVGWIAADALMRPQAEFTHVVTAPRTLAFPGPSIKLPPSTTLFMGSALRIRAADGALAQTSEGEFISTHHIATVSNREVDPVAVALRFLETPYLWGGKTADGIDCSGLVQMSLSACGIGCPRDSDMQEHALGSARPTDVSSLARGDLLFWPGHVAMAVDAGTIIHANAYHMAVTIEDTHDAVARIAAAGSPLRAVRRL